VREYRGKRVDNDEFVYGSLVNNLWVNTKDGVRVAEIISLDPDYDGDCWEDVISDCVVEVDSKSVGQFIGICDKNGDRLFEKDRVLFQGKEYEVKYFEDFAMYGLVGKSAYRPYNENEPMGSGGSSTSYKPYILNKYYQKRIEIVK